MRTLIMSLIALCGASCLVGSQSDQKLAKYHELKESAAYKELARVLYSCHLPTVLVDEVAGMLAVIYIDTSNRVFTRGHAILNYTQQDGCISFGDKLMDLDTLGVEENQQLSPLVLGSGAARAYLLDGQLAILDAQGQGMHDLGQNISCMQALTSGPVAAGYATGKIVLFNPITGKQTNTIITKSNVTALDEMPDGHLVSGHEDGRVRIWSPESGECLQQCPVHQHGIILIANRSGKYLMVLGRNYVATVWALTKQLHITESASSSSSASTPSSPSSSSSSSSSESEIVPVSQSTNTHSWSVVEVVGGLLNYMGIDFSN